MDEKKKKKGKDVTFLIFLINKTLFYIKSLWWLVSLANNIATYNTAMDRYCNPGNMPYQYWACSPLQTFINIIWQDRAIESAVLDNAMDWHLALARPVPIAATIPVMGTHSFWGWPWLFWHTCWPITTHLWVWKALIDYGTLDHKTTSTYCRSLAGTMLPFMASGFRFSSFKFEPHLPTVPSFFLVFLE